MTGIRQEVGPTNPARIAAEKLANSEGTLGLTRADAEAILAKRGITQGSDLKPVYTPAAAPPAQYPQDAVISADAFAAMRLPTDLARVIAADLAAAGTVIPEQVAATYKHSTASSYQADLASVAAFLAPIGTPVRADQLPAHSLRQLAVYARHIARGSSR